jgi:spore photoproduct lyase
MFTSANYVLFVNYEDFAADIAAACARHAGLVHVFSGYDCDSLALEPLTGFAAYFVDAFATIGNAVLELRTKSTQIRSLLAMAPHEHSVVAMSLAPDIVAERLEHGAPSLSQRLSALRRLQAHGWPVGLRFDPLIPLDENETVYRDFFANVFNEVDPHAVHSVTLGTLRLPRAFAKRMLKLYPEERLFAAPFADIDGTWMLRRRADDVLDSARAMLARYVDAHKIFFQHAPSSPLEPAPPEPA